MWRLISNKRNRDIIGWLGAGTAVIAGGAWAVYIHLGPVHSSTPPRDCKLEASSSVAACGDINGLGPIQIDAAPKPNR
jgi:hypothetical protein